MEERRWPTVLAVYHFLGREMQEKNRSSLISGQERLTAIFEEASQSDVPRKVFIEQLPIGKMRLPKMIQRGIRTGEFLNPHLHAEREARRRGWRTVSLDSGKHISRHSWYGEMPGDLLYDPNRARWNELNNRYVNTNYRERCWALEYGADFGPNDFVVLHPPHVVGFLEETGIPESRVIWIHQPLGHELKRLNAEELKEFQKLRRIYDLKRKIRVARRRRRNP